jgi:branched-chain amino acid transport system permease protein
MAANIRPAGVFDTTYGQDIALNRTRTDKLISNGLFLLLLLIPLLTREGPFGLNVIPSLWIGTIIHIAIFAIAVQGLNILVGYTGQTSLGHAAFMAVGAYSAAIFARELGFSFWAAVPAAALFTGFVGLLFGLPSLRVKGFYLAMATLAAQFIIPWLLRYPLSHLTNGSRPLDVPIPTLGAWSLSSDAAIYYVIIPAAVFLFLAARNITRTRVGRAFISIRDNDLAAELLGINVFNYKLQAFFLSAVYAGIAGALLAFQSNSLSLDKFTLIHSIEMLAMLVIGGAGFSLGPLFGVGFVHLLNIIVIPSLIPELQRVLPGVLPFLSPINIQSSLRPVLFGLALIIFLIIEPRGLAHRWEILKISWKIRPYSH